MSLRDFVNFLLVSWTFVLLFLFAFGLISYFVLITGIFHRVAQRRDPHFELHPTAPTHAVLFGFCAAVYGVLFPAFYFPTVRFREDFIVWHLGPHANNPVTLLLGAVSIVWLAGKLVSAINGGHALRFGGRLDRIIALLALILFCWFEFWLLVGMGTQRLDRWEYILMNLVYPNSFLPGAIFVYFVAWSEAGRNPAQILPRRASAIRLSCSAAALFVMLSPWILSIPRVSAPKALAQVQANLDTINEAAKRADLDPRLLAGIVYASQATRPRWTAKLFEEISVNSLRFDEFSNMAAFDAPTGLCGLRLTQCMEVSSKLESYYINKRTNGGINHGSGSDLVAWLQGKQPIRELKYVGGSNSYSTRYYYYSYNPDAIRADNKNSITLAAVKLHLAREQWKNTGHLIDNRPEILATLYQIDFDKASPKADPKPSRFGLRVKAFMDSPECAALFPKEANP